MIAIIKQLAREVAWAPVLVFLAHEIAGGIFGHEPCVDPVMHFLGGAAMAYFLRRAAKLTPNLLGAPSAFALDLLAFGLTGFIAMVWEFGELGSDVFLGTNIQVHASNTLRDLGLGLGGACLALVIQARVGRAHDGGSVN